MSKFWLVKLDKKRILVLWGTKAQFITLFYQDVRSFGGYKNFGAETHLSGHQRILRSRLGGLIRRLRGQSCLCSILHWQSWLMQLPRVIISSTKTLRWRTSTLRSLPRMATVVCTCVATSLMTPKYRLTSSGYTVNLL